MTERPDRVSAALSARLQGSRVLVAEETTESTLTYINPDGTITLEASSGPVRVKQNDKWTPVDTTLVQTDGLLKPRASLADVEFSAGGDGKPLATLKRSNKQSYALTWPTPLPVPKIEGNKATYPDAAGPAADLVVTALPTGFQHDIVLRERPTEPVEYKIPVETKGLKLAETDQGGLQLTDAKGKTVASAPEPVMHEAASQTSNASPPAAAGGGKAASTGAIDTQVVEEGGQQHLILKPDPAYLANPNTAYPLVVDPTITLNVQSSRTIYAPCADGVQLSPNGMVAGIIDSYWSWNGCGSHGENDVPARALLKFDTSSLTGQQVVNARLDLTATMVGYEEQLACPTGRTLKARRLTADWAPATVVWNNQPATTSDGEATSAPPAVCDGASLVQDVPWSIPITPIAQAWASGAEGHGLRLGLNDEATNAGNFYWEFSAATLAVTYGATPWTENLRAAPVVGSDGVFYTNTTTPSLTAGVQASGGGLLRADFVVEHDPADSGHGTGGIWSGAVDEIQAGSNAKVAVPAGLLADGWKIRWRVRTSNGSLSSDWSSWQSLTIDTTPPVLVAGSTGCTHPEGTWKPLNWNGDSQCFMQSHDPDLSGFMWGLDDPAMTTWLPVTSGTSQAYVPLDSLPDGWHTVYIKARDKAHNSSTVWTQSFGIGVGGLASPKDKSRTQRAVTLAAAAEPPRTEVTYYYRTGSLPTSSWTVIPPADVSVPGSGQPLASWPQARQDTSINFGDLSWDMAKTLQEAGHTDGHVEIRACFWKDGSDPSTSCAPPITVTLDRSAFGGSYATADVGPGQVALQTGDFSITSADASLFGISVSRALTTLNPGTDRVDEQLAENKVFGPGWRAGFPSAPSGIADFVPTSGGESGSMQLVGADGSTLSYVKDGTSFVGVGDAADGTRITTTSEEIAVTDSTGAKTTYTKANGKWVVARTETPAAESAVTYYRDAQGRVSRILAPVAAGVTCGTTLVAGCRALELSYAASTTATGVASGWGDFKDQAKSVSFTAFDPESNAMKTTVLASYLYDSTGRLRQVTDPRVNLSTVYYYTGEGRVSQITPPGLAPWRFEYDGKGRLAHVQREGGDVDPTQAVAYDVPIGGTGAPIDLTAVRTATWGQATDLPVTGAAVFPASHVPARAADGAYRPAAADWEYAGLSYTDVNGRQVNAAAYGAGAWQIGATRHDDKGNAVWALSPGNRAQALIPTVDTDPYVAGQADSSVRANLLATTSTFNADSDLLTSEGPAHLLALTSNVLVSGRQRTSYTYDEGKPSSSTTYHLVTTTKVEPVVLDGTAAPAIADVRTNKTGYDPIKSGDTSGWNLRQPTSTTTVMPGGTDIVKKARYDAAGREIERRQPASNGGDAGTYSTAYYTVNTHPHVVECGNKPQWAGLECHESPVTQPADKPIPVSYGEYGYYGAITLETETSGTVVRTNTTRHDNAGRTIKVVTTVTPEQEGGSPLPEITTSYDPDTGLSVMTTMGSANIVRDYDSHGRLATYQDADGNTATYTYDAYGRLSALNDGKGTYTYTYDGLDAAGHKERRGKATKVEASGVGSFASAYDAQGQMVRQTLPGGLISDAQFDSTGKKVKLSYAKNGTSWLSFSLTPDASGRSIRATSPASTQVNGYDFAGRLSKVEDTYAGACTTRLYEFDANSNRTKLSTYTGASGPCSMAEAPQTEAHTYDAADRITDSGYTYDAFGRTLTTPASHAEGGGSLTATFYVDDKVASLQQNGVSRSFTLDPIMRIRASTQVGGARPGTITNHHASDTDSPHWTSEADGSWTRNIAPYGDLVAIQDSQGAVSLQLSNLHADIVAVVTNDGSATGVQAYSEQTEYGVSRVNNQAAPTRFGWLGGKQRSSDALAGIMLMGVRLYNPRSGRFLQTDPIPGGSANAYDYVNQDPCNSTDLTGTVPDDGGGGLSRCRGGTYALGNGFKAKVKIFKEGDRKKIRLDMWGPKGLRIQRIRIKILVKERLQPTFGRNKASAYWHAHTETSVVEGNVVTLWGEALAQGVNRKGMYTTGAVFSYTCIM